jgi:2',3'-cyclic-nucleotide 2'-phosphodiesterase/3'-nucleotidase
LVIFFTTKQNYPRGLPPKAANNYFRARKTFYLNKFFGGIFLSDKLKRLFLSLVFCLAVAVAAFSPQVAGAAEKEIQYLPFNFTVEVFTTGHIHGHIIDWDYTVPQSSDIGLAKVYTLIKQERAQNPRTLLLDAGSFLYGSAMTTHYANTGFKGMQPMIKASNFMFYDALALGETDFAYGAEKLTDAISKSNAAFLAANITDSQNGKFLPKTQPYIIKTIDIGEGKAKTSVKIGVIGVTESLPANELNSSLTVTNQVDAVNKYVKELQGQKVDAIIVVTHSALNMRAAQTGSEENPVIAIAQNCPGINLIISSNRFAIIDETNPVVDRNQNVIYERARINGVPIISSGQNGAYLGKATLTFEMFGRKYWLKTVATTNLSTAGVVPDREFLDMAWPYHDSTLQAQTRVLGHAVSDFTATDVASRNLAAIGFLNEVQLHFSQAQLSAASLFNFDPKLKAGAITVQDVNTFYPFDGNYLYAIQITGAELKKYLEHSARYYTTFKEGDRVITVGGDNALAEFNYDIIQGVNYVINVAQPPGERVSAVTYRGQEVSDTDTFTLALSSMRYNGAGGYMAAMGFNPTNPAQVVFNSQTSTNGQIRELIKKYISEKKTISPQTPTNLRVEAAPFEPVKTHF